MIDSAADLKMLKPMLILLLFLVAVVSGRNPSAKMFPEEYPPMKENGDPGQPLFLTPYLQKGEIEKARQLSLVGPLPGAGASIKSYSGYLTVNGAYNSNIFFWFFPAFTDPANAPVLVWLQGGPGGSSLFGLFVEHGPFKVTESLVLVPNNYTWVQKYSMLYIDNPVGTGFSFTQSDAGYATNEDEVARDLYSMLIQFFQIYYEYAKNDFYVTGESYAGKYVPAISYKIHLQNQLAPKVKINLKGMAIGDGLCDPESMMNQYATFMYSLGLLDENQREYFQMETDKAVVYIRQQNFLAAFKIFDMLLNGDLTKSPPYFENVTGTTDYYNFLYTVSPKDFGYYGKLLAEPSIRAAIHVGNLTYNNGSVVEKHLENDIMNSSKPMIEPLLNNNYKALFYNGQLDIIIAVPLSETFLYAIPWKGQAQYHNTTRLIWKIQESDVDVAGYVRQVNNFYQVIVRGAGHILPYDQPARGWDMIQRFIENRSYV